MSGGPGPIPTDLAWAAGFFDGEGCVMIRGKTQVSVAVTNTHLPSLRLLHNWFGGTVRRTQRVDRDEVRQAYQWYAGGDIAVRFLEAIGPHLVVKHYQVRVALSFRNGGYRAIDAARLIRGDKRYEYRV